MATNESNQCLFGVIYGRPKKVVTEQRAVPPSDFIVGEIPYAVSIAFVGSYRFSRLSNHPIFD